MTGKALNFALCAATGLALAACEAPTRPRGYVIDDAAIAQVKPGSSAEQALLVLGTPSTVATVGGKTYYYISQLGSQRFQFMQESVTDQRVLAVYIDGKNKVERIANYGIEDGKIFDFITRTTPSGGADLTLLRQILKAPGSS